MSAALRMDRRGLLAGAAGLVVALASPGAPCAQPTSPARLDLFLRIAVDGGITVVAPCSEMGQGSHSALAQIVADELGADWSRITVVPAPLDDAYRTPGSRLQYTSGSAMVRRWNLPLRRSAAAARSMLVEAAARGWAVPVAECQAEDGKVLHLASGRTAEFGSLAAAAAALPLPAETPLRTNGKLVGKVLPRLDIPAKVNGSAIYGADVRLPGMVYAAIRQSPVFGARLAAVNAEAVTGRRGIVTVVQLPDAVAVLADSWWRAQRALDDLDVQFTEVPQGRLTSELIAASQRLQLDNPVAVTAIAAGDVAPVMASDEVFKADYHVPYLHHASIETQTCTVHRTGDWLEYWVPTQNLTGVAEVGTRLMGIPPSRISVHVTQIGGGFGRKFEQDFVEQATLIAREVNRPVQLIWSRQEDTQHGRYRPMMTARLSAVVRDGDLEAVSLRVVGPSIPEFRSGGVPFTTGYDPRAVLGIASETAQAPGKFQHYHAPNFLTEVIYQPAHVPCGSWRSVGASENGFFIESFVDELAVRAGADPYRFRRHLLRRSLRALAVLDKAAAEAGWDAPRASGRHLGIAFVECVGTLVAQVAEISMDGDRPVVHRITCALDCGTAVCPDNVRAQTEGSIVMGIGATLTERITIRDGRCVESSLADYRVPSLADTPRIDVHIIDSGEELGGVGEAALPATAPAVCNALFAATGRRVRSLPVDLG